MPSLSQSKDPAQRNIFLGLSVSVPTLCRCFSSFPRFSTALLLEKVMQIYATQGSFGINQSKLKLMNKKYRNRSSNKVISLSFPLCLSFFFCKKIWFLFFMPFFLGAENTDCFLLFFKQPQQTENCVLLPRKRTSSNISSFNRNKSWHFCFRCIPMTPFGRHYHRLLTCSLQTTWSK